MRLGILGKLTLLNALIITLTIVIISTLSWYNNSNYVLSRLNTRFPTLAILKAEQIDQYLLYTRNSIHSLVSRVLVQNATVSFLHDQPITMTMKESVQEDLKDGANTTLEMLSARIIARSPNDLKWTTIFCYTPETTQASHFTRLVFETLPLPPVEGIINPFTFTGEKYVFVLTTPMIKGEKESYLQVIFDSARIEELIMQVTNSAEANTEYILVGGLSDTSKFQVLLPTLYHPHYAQRIYNVSSDDSVKALFASAKPVSTGNGLSITNYTSGIIYDYRNFDGHQVTGGYTRLYSGSSLGWGLIVQAPQRQVQEPLRRLKNVLLIAAFSCLVLMLVFLMPIVWYCARPVRRLRVVTRAAHEAPINTEGLSRSKPRMVLGCIPSHFLNDEVTDIKESFMALAETLNEQYSHLDRIVAARTTALLAAQQEAVAANAAKSTFLANMSHEIRSPLQGVITLADINMLEDQNVSDEVKQTLATIRDSGSHLLYLISDILDFSKIEAGHLVLEERVFTLGSGLINQLRISFAQKAKSLGIGFSILTDPPALYQYNVRGDKHRIYQILQNLLSNSFKFTVAGSVTFKIAHPHANIFHFIIEDTGCGIPSNVIPTLFQPFTQADQSYSRKFGGTGLGLAVSRQLAGLMEGEITVTSEEDKGSIFTLIVPLTIVKQRLDFETTDTATNSPISQVSQQSRISLAHSVRNVMIADDNLINRQVISKMLKRCGVSHVTLAENGNEAFEHAQKRNFDLILMDLGMPYLNGFDATRKLREDGYEGVIIALTAHIGMKEHKQAVDMGCDMVATKPISLDSLKTLLSGIGR